LSQSSNPRPTPVDPALRRATRSAALFVLLLVPLFLRVWPIGHGGEANYVPDTHIVRSALGMAKDRTLVPEVGTYSTYPNLLPYLLLPAYSAQYVIGRVSGSWASAAEFGDVLLEQPVRAHRIARLLIALLGAVTPWLVFRTARAAGLGIGAWAAAWLVATGLLHVHFSVQERPWVPVVTFMALAAWPAAIHAQTGSLRALLLSGCAAGLSLACHQAGLGALAICGFAWLFGPRGFSGSDLVARVREGALCVAAFALVALLLGHPYVLVHGRTPDESVAANAELSGDFSIGGQAIIFGVSLASFKRLALMLIGYDPVLVVLALVGLAYAWRYRALRPAVAFALLWGLFFMTNPNDKVRYLLPLSVFGALLAGVALEQLWKLVSVPIAAALLALLAFPLVQAGRLGWVLRQPDTRALAVERLAQAQPERVAVDCYGPSVPKNQAALERLSAWRPLGARERHRLAALRAGTAERPGLDVVPIEDLFEFEFRSGTSWLRAGREDLGDQPQAIFAKLGVSHVLIVDRAPQDGRVPLLLKRPHDTEPALEPLEVERPAEWVIHPAKSPSVACEASLPTEMSFALSGIWRAQRPGPRLEFFRLHR